ncbi:MAG: hypothetical protein IPK58_19225 [Acidobacteria bacterium]|nr:hypothetical protein [Acidobacteriota bacterium]
MGFGIGDLGFGILGFGDLGYEREPIPRFHNISTRLCRQLPIAAQPQDCW